MKKSKIYQYAILWHPTKEQSEGGSKSKFIVPVTTGLFSDENMATMSAFIAIPEEYRTDLEQLEVVVKPF